MPAVSNFEKVWIPLHIGAERALKNASFQVSISISEVADLVSIWVHGIWGQYIRDFRVTAV